MTRNILRAGARPEPLFSDAFYTEGPAQGPDGRIYFCDLTPPARTGGAAGNIWAYDPVGGGCEVYRSPSGMASGIKFDSRGRMVVATGADFGSRAVIRTDMATGRSRIMAGLYNGRPFNAPNDLVIDAGDRIYFTDPRYAGHEPVEQPVFGVYRIDPDGSVSLILADVSKPNGIDLSPDQRTLYVVEHDIGILDRRIAPVPLRDHGRMRLLAYVLDDGVARDRRTIVDFGQEKGADGMAVDAEGNLYLAVQSRDRPGIRIFSPAGLPLADVPMPETPANCCLVAAEGGADLYVTAGRSLYRLRTAVPPPVAGRLGALA